MASTVPRDRARTRALLACGLLAPVALIGFILTAAAMTPEYSHVANTVSQLAAQGRPHPRIMGAGFVVYGLLVLGFAAGLRRHLAGAAWAGVAAAGLSLFGLAVLASGFFRDYNEAAEVPAGVEGLLHSLFAQIAVLGLLVGMAALVPVLRRLEPRLAATTVAAAIAIASSGLLFLLLPRQVQGLTQRVLYALTSLWIVLLAHWALRDLASTGRPQQRARTDSAPS